ncbi:chemotaxis protein [Mannheimia indoligenes]|uniref:chemotaxis protein n=1 Tax=Mannheimia indoligenes TaxID=3103145 RepID=UPI002FE5FD74
MPIPFVVGAAVAAAAAFGGKKAYDGHNAKKEAKDIAERAGSQYEKTKQNFDEHNEQVSIALETLGQFELKIGSDMNEFQIIASELLNKLSAAKNSEVKINLPEHRLNKIADLSLSATSYLGGLAGGTAVGAAASFAMYSGVIAFAAASTGTPIAALSGAAAYNATMAAIGGGSIAAGGWGMAAAPYVLGGAAMAPILAVAGYLYNRHAEKALKNAEEFKNEVHQAVNKMRLANHHLFKVTREIKNLTNELERIYVVFSEYFEQLKSLNTLIKNNMLSVEIMNDNLVLIIQNGYQLAAIMTDIITTPLFKMKKSPDGLAVVEAKKDEKGNEIYVPVIEKDENDMQVLNFGEIDTVLAKGSDEEIQKVLMK